MKYTILLLALFSTQFLFSQDQMYDVCPLKVGEKIPAATLTKQSGKPLPLVDIVNNRPTIVIFYRGAWCGYCTKHLAELNDAKKEIEDLGFQIFGVTVDQPDKLSETTKESNSEIEVYSDKDANAVKAFGLDWNVDEKLYKKYKTEYKLDLEEWSGQEHHLLPVPAVFVFKDGIVQFQYVNPNYRTRLSAESLVALLQTL